MKQVILFCSMFVCCVLSVMAGGGNKATLYRRNMNVANPVPSAILKVEPYFPPSILANTKPSAFENVNMIVPETDNQPMQNESSIAVNPRNTNIVIGSAVDYRKTSSTHVYVSTNGGKTFENISLGTPPGLNFTSSNDPSVAFDATGRGYLCYGGFDRNRTTGENGVFVAVTTDNGATWTSHIPVILHTGKLTPDSAFEDKYYVVTDKSPSSPYLNHAYIPWKRVIDRDSSTQIVFSKSSNGGLNWSAPIAISERTPGNSEDTTFGQSFPLIATGPNGEVYCVWNFGPKRSVGFSRSLDGGATWTSPRLVQQYEWLGTTMFTGSQYNHTLKGKTRVESYPSLVVDTTQGPRRGWMYLTWVGDKVPNVYFSRSTDRGDTWSTPKIVHTDTTNDQFWQWVALDGTNGDLAVMYLDSRDDATNIFTRCYVSYSSDGGETWLDRLVSDAESDIRRNPFNGVFAGDYSGCAFYNGIILPSWVDMRNTTSSSFADNDAYTAIINVRAPQPATNFVARTIPAEPKAIDLSWQAPTARSFGQPLALSDFRYSLYRDGVFLTALPSSATTYKDNVPTAYKAYDYQLLAVTALDSSAPRNARAFAGGSPEPDTVQLLSVQGSAGRITDLKVKLPSLRSDNTTPLLNLKAIEIYRDSVLVSTQEVQTTDAGKTLSVFDIPTERGYYTYSIRVKDSDENRSVMSNYITEYTGEVNATLSENFDGTMPRFLRRGGWQQTDEFALSTPYSITESKGTKYGSVQRDTLTLFPVVSPTGFLRLQFSHAAIIHPSDSAFVEYSTDKRQTWKRIERWNKNSYDAWNQNAGLTAEDWKPEVFTIVSKDTVYIRFRFWAGFASHDDGWYIDNIATTEAPVSVEESPTHSIALFPNPALNLVSVPASENHIVEIFSVTGVNCTQLCTTIEQRDNARLLSIEKLATGTYIVRLQTTTSTQSSVLQIVR